MPRTHIRVSISASLFSALVTFPMCVCYTSICQEESKAREKEKCSSFLITSRDDSPCLPLLFRLSCKQPSLCS